MYLRALISAAFDSASSGVIRPSLVESDLRSPFVPTRMIGTAGQWCCNCPGGQCEFSKPLAKGNYLTPPPIFHVGEGISVVDGKAHQKNIGFGITHCSQPSIT